MTDNRDFDMSSASCSVVMSLELCSPRAGAVFCASIPVDESSSVALCRLAMLLDRFVKLLAKLATLNFLIMELADARTRCSLRARPVIPGNGRMSRVQTSARRVSSRTRSARDGARTGMRFVVRRDCDLLIEAHDAEWGILLREFVFLMITWQSPDFGPTVVALWMEILLAIVPTKSQLWP
jgi:hypothetical protein